MEMKKEESYYKNVADRSEQLKGGSEDKGKFKVVTFDQHWEITKYLDSRLGVYFEVDENFTGDHSEVAFEVPTKLWDKYRDAKQKLEEAEKELAELHWKEIEKQRGWS